MANSNKHFGTLRNSADNYSSKCHLEQRQKHMAPFQLDVLFEECAETLSAHGITKKSSLEFNGSGNCAKILNVFYEHRSGGYYTSSFPPVSSNGTE